MVVERVLKRLILNGCRMIGSSINLERVVNTSYLKVDIEVNIKILILSGNLKSCLQ